MSSSAPYVGAGLGLAVQLYANAVQVGVCCRAGALLQLLGGYKARGG